jgi:hypothetical protein
MYPDMTLQLAWKRPAQMDAGPVRSRLAPSCDAPSPVGSAAVPRSETMRRGRCNHPSGTRRHRFVPPDAWEIGVNRWLGVTRSRGLRNFTSSFNGIYFQVIFGHLWSLLVIFDCHSDREIGPTGFCSWTDFGPIPSRPVAPKLQPENRSGVEEAGVATTLFGCRQSLQSGTRQLTAPFLRRRTSLFQTDHCQITTCKRTAPKWCNFAWPTSWTVKKHLILVKKRSSFECSINHLRRTAGKAGKVCFGGVRRSWHIESIGARAKRDAKNDMEKSRFRNPVKKR